LIIFRLQVSQQFKGAYRKVKGYKIIFHFNYYIYFTLLANWLCFFHYILKSNHRETIILIIKEEDAAMFSITLFLEFGKSGEGTMGGDELDVGTIVDEFSLSL